MQLRESPRSVSFLGNKGTLCLTQEAEENEEDNVIPVYQSKGADKEKIHANILGSAVTVEQHFGFSLHTTASEDKGDLLLRVNKVDELLKWMNALAEAAGLDYDPSEGVWNHEARQVRLQRQMEEAAERDREVEEEKAAARLRQEEVHRKARDMAQQRKQQEEELVSKKKAEAEAMEKQEREASEKDEREKKELREREEERIRLVKLEKQKKIAAKKKVAAEISSPAADSNTPIASTNLSTKADESASSYTSASPVMASSTESVQVQRSNSTASNGSSDGNSKIMSPIAKARAAAKAKRKSLTLDSPVSGSEGNQSPTKQTTR